MSTTAPSLVGRTVDRRYVVRGHIADGGMGSVYVALDQRLDREVALKIMRADLARDEAFVERFRREARSAARLSHPNVVAVTDQGQDENHVFLAMELVRGRTLRELIKDDAPLPLRQALDIVDGILQALSAAHRAGLVHRDIKPENVIIGDSGVKVADFGLARAVTTETLTTDNDVLLGTAAYLSPEQVEFGRADERSDVYSTGLLLFELLTGEKAFPGDVPIHVAYQHVHGSMPIASDAVPTIPREVDELIARATARNPEDRPENATAFLQELRHTRTLLDPESMDTAPAAAVAVAGDTNRTDPLGAGSTRQLRRAELPVVEAPPRRRWSRLLLMALAVVVVLGAVGTWLFTAGPLGSVTMPRVVGMPQSTAVTRVHHAGLGTRIEQIFSETVPAGTVVSTSPNAGGDARRDSDAVLRISKGPLRFTVPSVVLRNQSDATAAIKAASLSIGSVTQAYSDTVPSGQVISTDPAAGTSQKPGTAVDIVVSKGKQPITIPDVTNQTKAAAQTTLTGLGLKVSFAAQQNSSTVPSGQVISESPGKGGTAYKGDTITLTISKGPVMVTVPKVVGDSSSAAKQALEAAGFKVKVNYPLLVPVLFIVQGQSVSGGSQAPQGSTITIDVV